MGRIIPFEPHKKQITEPISRLIQGNYKFYKVHANYPDIKKPGNSKTSDCQNPFAAIICSTDPRVRPELIFDQDLGDLFILRSKEAAIDTFEIERIEYAIEQLNVKLVVVMGHQHYQVASSGLENDTDDTITFAKANIMDSIEQLRMQSLVVESHLKNGQILLIGAIYHTNTGYVDFIN